MFNSPDEQKQQDQMGQRLHISWHRLLPCMYGNTVLLLLATVEIKLVHVHMYTPSAGCRTDFTLVV